MSEAFPGAGLSRYDAPSLALREAMRRREFIKLFGGAVAAWPIAARAQERVRRIGVLMTTPLGDPETHARTKAFLQGMQELGWTEGRNIQFELDIASLGPAQLLHSLQKSLGAGVRFRVAKGRGHKHTDAPHSLLCACSNRPRCHRTAEKFDEFEAPHSIPQG